MYIKNVQNHPGNLQQINSLLFIAKMENEHAENAGKCL